MLSLDENEDILKKIAESGDGKKSCRELKLEAYYNTWLKEIMSREGLDWLIKNGFCTAPASTKYHGSYPGGLFDHSYNVAKTLVRLTMSMSLNWERPQSPVIVGLLHDLCKIDQYRSGIQEEYVWNDRPIVKGHGIKSVVYIQKYLGIELTEEEMACILYHMGAFTPQEEWKDYTNAIHTFENVLWTHTADMYASHVLEVI